MKVWMRGAALASAALFWAGTHVGAQIRQSVSLAPARAGGSGLTERPNHPVVLLNSHEGTFTGVRQVVTQLTLKQLDPAAAVEQVAPPKGIDGIIAYPGSRMLIVRGTEAAVAGYRSALESADRQAGTGVGNVRPNPSLREAPNGLPVIVVPARGKLQLQADRLAQEGTSTEAIGHVLLKLPNGVELHARQVRIVAADGQRRIEIER